MDFIKELTGIVAAILIVNVGILTFIFRKQLVAAKEKMEKVAQLDNSHTITDKALMIRFRNRSLASNYWFYAPRYYTYSNLCYSNGWCSIFTII